MNVGICERCKENANGGRICIRCDDWETVLGRLIKMKLDDTVAFVDLSSRAKNEGRFPPQFRK
jgi:hypothetical protein